MSINISAIPLSERGKLALKKISPQFPESPEGQLMLAVVGQAIRDLSTNQKTKSAEMDRRTAKAYLTKEIPAAELCGVSSVWIHGILERLVIV